MEYIKVTWKHSDESFPVVLYSELDQNRFETRKIEVFADGHCGYADSREIGGVTRLGLEPVPPLFDIASDPEFEVAQITREQFEQVWAKRKSKGSCN